MEGLLFESPMAIFFLNVAVASVVIGIVAAIVCITFKRASCPLRHGVLCIALTFMLISPLALLVANRMGIGWITVPIDRGVPIELDSFPYSSADLHDEFSKANAGTAGILRPFNPTDIAVDESASDEVPITRQQVPATATPQLTWAAYLGIDSLQSMLELIALAFLFVWSIGSFYLGCRFLYRMAAVMRLKRRLTRSTNPRLHDLAQQAFRLLELKNGIPIVESPSIPVPVTLGWINPVIGIPPELAQALDDEELTSVFLHEAAHVERRDQFIGLLQQVATALYWWNPFWHGMNCSICRLREQLCDDVTSLKQGSGVPLASSIVRVAEWAASKAPTRPISVALLEDYRALEDRISRLTTSGRAITIRLGKNAAIGLYAIAMGLGTVSLVPLLNAFEVPMKQFTQVSTRVSNSTSDDSSKFTTDDSLSLDERHRKEVGIRVRPPIAISVSGVVRSYDDQPIANATVYLVSHYLADKPLAETRTDAAGRYEFRNVPLPLFAFERTETPQGRFQIIATAEGFGLAWHGYRQFMMGTRPDFDPVHPQNSAVYQNERIEMNLVMEKPTTLRGQIKDDGGQPISNATIVLRDLDYLKTEGRLMSESDRQCGCIVTAPPDYCETKTDADGRFQFPSLPQGSVAFLQIAHDDFAEQWLYVAMTNEPITQYRYIANVISGGSMDDDGTNYRPDYTPIWETRTASTSPVSLQMRSTRRVQVTLTQPNGQPAPKGTAVSASAGTRSHQDSSSDYVDANGQVQLSLPPGHYVLLAQPPRYSNLRISRTDLHVPSEPQQQQFSMEIAEGCVVQFEAIDSKTGKGIPGVTFSENIGNGSHQGLSNETTRLDYPVTDENGRLRAIAFPGTRRYQQDHVEGYVYDPKEIEVTCEVGKTVHIQFKLQPER